MKTTHKTVYTMDIKRHNVCCWLIGNCRDEPLTQRRKKYKSTRTGPPKDRIDITVTIATSNPYPAPYSHRPIDSTQSRDGAA